MATMLLVSALVVFLYVNLIHLLAWWKQDNGIMDIAWGPGFVLVAWVSVVVGGPVDARHGLLVGLVKVLAISFFGAEIEKIPVWGLLLLILVFRPSGLFGASRIGKGKF